MGNWFCCCIEDEMFVPIETVYRYDENYEPAIYVPKWETKLSKRN